MRNDVKDWLPSDFQETVELEWFGRHFVGERFVLLTWPGFTEDSPKARLLIDKLEKETVPADLDDVEPTMPASGNLAADETSDEEAKDDNAPADAIASNADSSAPIDASPTVEGFWPRTLRTRTRRFRKRRRPKLPTSRTTRFHRIAWRWTANSNGLVDLATAMACSLAKIF
ncbi:MAG: hypothetical protein R3C99_12160 [Pirellulaceae bacterium]